MTDRCHAGVPDDQGRGGCRFFDHATKSPAATDGRARLCNWCLEIAERDVRALVLDYRDLEQHLPPALGNWGDGQPRGRSTPLPLNGNVLDLQHEIWFLTTAWDEVARDLDRLSDAPTRVREGWAVQQSVAILAPRLRRLAEIETPITMWSYPGCEGAVDVEGWRGVLDLSRLHHRARAALGLTNAQPQVMWSVACRSCDLVSVLVQMPGEDSRTCSRCGEFYSAVEYADWCALLAAGVRRNVVHGRDHGGPHAA